MIDQGYYRFFQRICRNALFILSLTAPWALAEVEESPIGGIGGTGAQEDEEITGGIGGTGVRDMERPELLERPEALDIRDIIDNDEIISGGDQLPDRPDPEMPEVQP